MESLGLVLAMVVFVSGTYDPVKEANEHPYIVSVHSNAELKSYLCAGSLIATTWVLTTANCLTELAFKICYGDMMTMHNTTYSGILKKIHHRNSRSFHQSSKGQYLIPKANNIGLAMIEEVPNRSIAMLSGIDYSAILGYQVTYFEFDLQPVFKARIYETKNIKIPKIKFPKIKPWPKVPAGKKNIFNEHESSHNTISQNDTKVLRTADGIAIKCQDADHPGPNMCVAKKCFSFRVSDRRISDYGAPLIYDKKLVGVTSEVEKTYTRYTPVSPYLDWIREYL